MSFSSLTVILVTTSKVTEDSIAKTKENLEMLNTAMFQSLRNAMNTGVPPEFLNFFIIESRIPNSWYLQRL